MHSAVLASALVAGAFAAGHGQEAPKDGYRLIEVRPDAPPVWLPAEAVEGLRAMQNPDVHGVPFADLTNHQHIVPREHQDISYPSNPNYREEVSRYIDNIDQSYPEDWLRALTDLHNRFFNTETGVQGALYIQSELDAIAVDSGRSDINVTLFEHTWEQPSVIARVPGSDAALANQLVILGAHEDSISLSGRAPGADDDGTGTVTVMEAFRVLVQSGFRPKRTVEFHFYAAEEVGLLGSIDVASDYNEEGASVHGMLQFDMNGCCRADSGLVGGTKYNVCTDGRFTDDDLTSFLRLLITSYGGMDQDDFRYGYAASDHASWARNGFPAAHVKEDVSYDPIHSRDDVWENIDFSYLTEFVKVGVAFAAELGEM